MRTIQQNIHAFFFALTLLLLSASGSAQINFTANTTVPAYTGKFEYGTNMGYYGASWNDISLSNIAAGNPALNIPGLNSKTFRLSLPEDFLEYWGYDVRLSEFSHYASLGVKENTVFLSGTATAHRDNADYGCGQTWMWANMFTPIWDGGANGTPINDTNYYALYVYKTVTRYKNNTKFWEIINEPDYDISGNGWKSPGQPGNWWDANPNPCALINLKAPIFHYIRLLRISYEIIKSIDPSAYIAVGGIGYASFLDGLLRNTDNPVDGSVTAEYPLRGGAYFDVVSFHNYPMYALMYWDNSILNFAYKRHSDAATDEYIKAKNSMVDVLNTYGYNNTTYPAKYFISTETNIPRVEIGDYIGSDQAQRNYIMKTLVEAQRNGIEQLYYFILGDVATETTVVNPYDIMGLYKRLEGVGPLSNGGIYGQQYNISGIGFRTTSELLHNYRYDAVRTTAMALPSTIGGAAFRDDAGNYRYALWAKTTVDKSESSSATYTFSPSLGLGANMVMREWDYSITNVNHNISSSNIALTGVPIFLEENLQIVPIHDRDRPTESAEKKYAFSVYPNPAYKSATIRFTLSEPSKVRISLYDQQGRFIQQIPVPTQLATGTHVFPLKAVAALASGVYFCRMETEKIVLIRKITIAK
jgi:hypothetical protein